MNYEVLFNNESSMFISADNERGAWEKLRKTGIRNLSNSFQMIRTE